MFFFTSFKKIFLLSYFILISFFTFLNISQAVILDPKDSIHHTTIIYYDGKFSETKKVEDIYTALYVLNQSNETIYATIYEYNKFKKEVFQVVQILGNQNQFIKTEGSGVVYLNNSDNTAASVIKFSRWAKFKYFIYK